MHTGPLNPALPTPQQGGASLADAEEFLSLTQQLALSSAFGAVQCSYGPVQSLQHSGEGGGAAGGQLPEAQWEQPDVVALVRFQDQAQLQQFLACPPVAALLEGDSRIPLAALWSCVLESQPSDNISSSRVTGGLM